MFMHLILMHHENVPVQDTEVEEIIKLPVRCERHKKKTKKNCKAKEREERGKSKRGDEKPAPLHTYFSDNRQIRNF
jgi:CRISPR/Cas system-associated endonuclease Cas3-HD